MAWIISIWDGSTGPSPLILLEKKTGSRGELVSYLLYTSGLLSNIEQILSKCQIVTHILGHRENMSVANRYFSGWLNTSIGIGSILQHFLHPDLELQSNII